MYASSGLCLVDLSMSNVPRYTLRDLVILFTCVHNTSLRTDTH